jgi:hypothetical protein
MSGREKALERLRAHEARRRAAWRPVISADERAYIRGHEVEVVRWMNQVDWAIAGIQGANPLDDESDREQAA